MRWSRTLLIATALLVGCGEDRGAVDASAPDLGIPALDLGVATADAARGTRRIGEPCRADSDCGEGVHPVCFAGAVSGFGPAATPGGYCSSTCGQGANDCGGDGALCMWFGFTRPYCFLSCRAATDCRAGYACFSWMASVCFPQQPFLDCDPTSGDGSCTTTDGKPGGCYRLARGAGVAGRCGARCQIGPHRCAADPTGAPLGCRTRNDIVDADGGVTGDRWAGPVCDLLTSSPVHNGACVYGWTTPPLHASSTCADGIDCGAQLDPAGDEDCHPVCYLPGGAATDDAGVPPCASGSCRDAFRLAGSADPSRRVGLCP